MESLSSGSALAECLRLVVEECIIRAKELWCAVFSVLFPLSVSFLVYQNNNGYLSLGSRSGTRNF